MYNLKSILLIIFLISPVLSKSLKQISLNTKWTYIVNRSNPFYTGKFIEKIAVQKIEGNIIDNKIIGNKVNKTIIDGLDSNSLALLDICTTKKITDQRAVIYFVIDSIFFQSLDSGKSPCPGARTEELSHPVVNAFDGFIIQTDSLRIQIINDFLIYIIPVMYDSATNIYMAERNYFSNKCENLRINEFRHQTNIDTNEAEFWGMVTTEYTDYTIIDSNGVQAVTFHDWSDAQPCNAYSTSTKLDTTKLSVRHSERMSSHPNYFSNSNYTNFLLNGRVIEGASMNSSRIEFTKSGNNAVRSPIIRFRSSRN
jgi:hypothetical protein